jgi:glycosyltransferase involved in cell wall biosynthesis
LIRSRHTRYDVVVYAPFVAPLLATNDVGATGGGETQVLLIARLLAQRGLRVCLCTYDMAGADIPARVDGVDIALRPEYVRNGRKARLREALTLVRDLLALDAGVYVTRIASYHVGLVALAARLRGRRFVYSSAHVLDFDFARFSPPLRDRVLFRLGLGLAHAIVVQTQEQAELCRRWLRRKPVLIRNVVEDAEPASGSRDTFLWIGRAVWYKAPLKYVELARELPEARFVAVCPPGPRTEDLTEELHAAAADVPNLEILPPRPRRELLPLLDRAVAVVNTSDYEGMPNATLEGWARGIPALTLAHDPDGLISRLGLGEFASGSWPAFVAAARRLWADRSDGTAISTRCLEHVRDEHSPDAITDAWLRVLRLERP